jgi:glutathione S-transferase
MNDLFAAKDASRDITICSVAACPYAQRTRILLSIKNIDARLVELDLSKKRPDWFLAINPAGKVPAIAHAVKPLNESSVINEYLEEVFSDPPVFPADAYQKAFSRILIDYCNNSFTNNMYRLLMEQDAAKRPRIEAAANKDWGWLNDMLTRATSLPQDHYALGFANGAIPPGHERSALDPEIPRDARPLPPRRARYRQLFGNEVFPTPGTHQNRPQRSSMLSIERDEFVADQLEAFDLILEWRKGIRQPPNIHLQSLDAFCKSRGIGNKERQIEFAGNPEQRFGHSRQRLLSRVPLPVHAGGIVQPSRPVVGKGCFFPHDPHRRGIGRKFAQLTEPCKIRERRPASEKILRHPDVRLERRQSAVVTLFQ